MLTHKHTYTHTLSIKSKHVNKLYTVYLALNEILSVWPLVKLSLSPLHYTSVSWLFFVRVLGCLRPALIAFLLYCPVFPEEQADLYEDGNNSNSMRALSCLAVVGIQILIIMDQLDLKGKKHIYSNL